MATLAENVVVAEDQTPVEEKVNGVEQKATNGVNCENGVKVTAEPVLDKVQEEMKAARKEAECEAPKEEVKKEEVAVEVEPKTGVSFPVKLDDGKQLLSVGLRKKSMLGMGIKIYGFGMYTDNEKLKDLLKSKIGKAPAKPTKEMYQLVIDSDLATMVKLVIVFSGLTMNMVKKNFDEGLGASIKKLTGGKKNEELANKVMGQASDEIKLTSGSVIEISRLPGYVLETKC
ncbi:fatty-acid-binding protein 1 isoform X2 [Jatropha curcas]|uniref:fatty-acid-binding protein 1 isoform X2 n=1 Tax=Jatropha curcas TaxID=180498 RepID=UPI0009D65C21|nr:fatty-acid-binding protein 1 isoform X2 [Jatropha curcas]